MRHCKLDQELGRRRKELTALVLSRRVMLDDDVGRMPHRRCSVQLGFRFCHQFEPLVAVGKDERENLLLLGMKLHS
jgi:hypothetical protein